MPFRESPAKRRKISHRRDDDERENAATLLDRFQARPTPSTKHDLNGNHGTSTQASAHERAPLRKSPPASHTRRQPAQIQIKSPRMSFPPFTDSTLEKLAKLRRLSSSYNGTTDTRRKRLTEEREGNDFTGQEPYSGRPVPTQLMSAYGNGFHTPPSGAAYHPAPAQANGMPQRGSMVPRDYPHGLPLPRPTNVTGQYASPYVPPSPPPPRPPARAATFPNTPIPLPSAPSANSSLQHPAPISRHPVATSSARPNPSPVGSLAAASAEHRTGVGSPKSNSSIVGIGRTLKNQWTLEEDSVIVYLKHGLDWGFKQIATVLTGRSQGAANTRYCNHLKYGYDMEKAIAVIQNSKWASILQPGRHAEILARPVPLPARPVPLPSVTVVEHTATTADSKRERRAAQRPTNYYSMEHYAHTFEDEASPVTELQKPPAEGHPGAQVADLGIEIEGRTIRSSRRLRSARKPRLYRPYLSHHERLALKGGFGEGEWQELHDWKGAKVHVPFTKEEIKRLEDVVTSKFDRAASSILTNMTEPEILEVASQTRSLLPTRTKESIEALLRDAADDRIPKPEVLRLGGQRYPSVNAVLRHRELGMRTARRDYSKGGLTPLQTPIVESIGPSITFTGTSGDVNTVAWTPNGTRFAAGSACLVDSDSMQYNRGNNLLVGEVHQKALYEIPDHYTERQRPETGVNSSHSMHVTQDHRLFQTVSMVAFSPDDSLLFTAGYDNQVRVYDIFDTEQPEKHFSCLALRHTAKVDLLSVSPQGLLATGCQRSDKNSIKVIDPYLLNVDPSELFDEDGNKMKPVMHSFSSRRAAERPENGIFPSALCFDWTGDYLLAGFASTLKEELASGGTCLWDVRTGAQMTIFPETRNVFDVAWNTNRWKAPLFAVGCVAGANVNRGVRSVVKLYDIRAPGRYTMPLELDCPALDMNDVLFSPYDDNLIVAGCTNGKTYVWDIRQPRPENHLYSLMHGEPLMELGDDDPASRERLDTGIRFCSWAHDRRKLYTASSDGVVKTWDPYRAPEDVFVRDVVQLNSGVMSGAFSPDYASLLIGEVNGTINLLEAGQLGRSIKQMDTFNLVSFKDEEASPPTPDLQDPSPDKDSGASIARELLRTDQMTLRQMGSLPIRQAVQGPNYAGPYDKAADAPELRTAAAQFQRLHSDPPTQQCGLLACRLAAAFINAVPEEAGDSGRSADRIPAALRSLALAATPPIREDDADGNGNGTSSMPAKTTIVPFAPKCSKCHVRPARPRAETDNGDIVDDDDDDDEQGVSSPSKNLLPLCERCNFGCPRCGRKAGILSRTPETTFAGVFCLRCRAVWRADVLGYKLVYQHTGKEDWDPRRDERFLYERARVMGIRKKVPSPPSASGAAEASPDGSGGSAAAGTANTGKKRAKETQLEKQRRRGHDYLAKEGEDSIEGYYHGLWQDRPPSPL